SRFLAEHTGGFAIMAVAGMIAKDEVEAQKETPPASPAASDGLTGPPSPYPMYWPLGSRVVGQPTRADAAGREPKKRKGRDLGPAAAGPAFGGHKNGRHRRNRCRPWALGPGPYGGGCDAGRTLTGPPFCEPGVPAVPGRHAPKL